MSENDINYEYISDGIMTLISYTLINNPEIFNVINKILSTDAKILAQKLNTFFEEDIEPLDGYSIIYLCTLMYNNDIMPNYICNILKELDVEISKNELQTNANNFINFIIKNQTVGGEKSNAFKNIFSTLKQISLLLTVIVILYFEHTFFTQNLMPTFQKTSSTVINYYDRLNTVLKDMPSCQNIPIHPMAAYIGKYGITNFDKLFQIANCLAINRINNPVIDSMISSRESYSPINTEKYTSFALVPIGHVFEENYPEKYKEDFRKDLDLVANNEEMVPKVIEKTNELSVKVYKFIKTAVPNVDSKAALDKYMENIRQLSEMPTSELELLLFPNAEEFEIKVDSNYDENSVLKSKLLYAFDFASDTVKLGLNVFTTAKSKGMSVEAINPLKSYIWTLQKYLKMEYRRLEDIKKQTEREFEDIRTEISQIIQNGMDLIYILPWLIFINSIVSSILGYFSCLVYYKLYQNKGQRAITNGEQKLNNDGSSLAIDNIVNDTLTGGKKRRTRRIRKLNKKSTKKYRKLRRHSKTKKYRKYSHNKRASKK